MAIIALAMVAIMLSGCHHIDNKRLPMAYVNITFYTPGEWVLYGVSGAAQFKYFIIQDKVPAGFPYTAMSATGFGGVLLCTTYAGVPVAYDLACPVECRANVRVYINDEFEAECPMCHSRYDVFEKYGYPIGGKAAEEGFGMEIYNVSPGPNGEEMTVRR